MNESFPLTYEERRFYCGSIQLTPLAAEARRRRANLEQEHERRRENLEE